MELGVMTLRRSKESRRRSFMLGIRCWGVEGRIAGRRFGRRSGIVLEDIKTTQVFC